MKESNYNYYVPYKHKVIFFNSLKKVCLSCLNKMQKNSKR